MSLFCELDEHGTIDTEVQITRYYELFYILYLNHDILNDIVQQK